MYLNLYSYTIFIPMIIISSSMIFISNSWMSNWMIMEINLISFLSLMIFEKKMNSEIPMNYFLIQSFNSYLFMASSINMNLLNNQFNNFVILVMNMSILTKMGSPPFYNWYIKVMNNLNWTNFLIMSTIQKIIPLIIFNNMININNKIIMQFNMINIIFSSFILTFLAMQTLNVKMIMTYSSMIQLSWMIMLMFINEMTSMNYFILYSFISYSLIYIFKKFNINYLNNLNLLKFNNNWMYFLMFMNIFSLASIPPSTGFLMKWISIQSMWNNFNLLMIIIMIFNSLISMYFYLRIMFISMFNMSMSIKMNFIKIKFYNKFNYIIISTNWILLSMLTLYEIF